MKNIIILISLIFFNFCSSLFAQRLKADIEVKLDRLTEEQKRPLSDFKEKLENYFNNHRWTNDEFGTDVNFILKVYMESYIKTGSEDTYQAQFLISVPSVKEQYLDKDWKFVYQQAEIFYHNSAVYHTVTHVLDYYAYLVLASEIDTYQKFGGTPFYQKAKEIIILGKTSKYRQAWQSREDELQDLLNIKNEPFREMKAIYYDGLWLLQEGKKAEAKEQCLKALGIMVSLLKQNIKNEFVRRFLKAHYMELVNFFDPEKDQKYIEKLAKLDPEHAEYYRKFIK